MVISQQPPSPAPAVEARSRRGVVAAGHRLSAAAGLGALAEGGNAIDAAVAAAFVSFVAEPQNAGVAGYGHLSAWLSHERGFLTVDHGPRAPRRASAAMFALDPGDAPEGHDWPAVDGQRNSVGGLAVAIPGAVPGLFAAHERAGRLPWERLLQPAIELAERGLEVEWGLLLEIAAKLDAIAARPAIAAILMPHGRLPRARTADAPGERLWQAELAGTLRAIAHAGPDALREGPIAAAIAAAVAAEEGILDADDLASYAPKVLAERPGRYRDLEYVTACDHVGYEALNILERFPLGELEAGGAEHLHLLAEAFGHAFVDNVTYWGDPDHTDSPIDGLGSSEFAAMRAAGIALDRAAPRPIAPADPWPYDTRPRSASSPPPPSVGGMRGTTQIVAADADGNLVSLITTIGDDFGSLVAVPGTGLLLNNSMMNYDPRPGRAGSIAPGKMPFFAVPALVAARDGRGVFAAAGAGGYPILAGVLCTFVNAIDHRMPIAAAAEQPRVHSQGGRTFIDRRATPQTRERLAEMGHDLVVQDVTPGELPFSRVGAALIEDQLCAGCSPSWSTAVGGL